MMKKWAVAMSAALGMAICLGAAENRAKGKEAGRDFLNALIYSARNMEQAWGLCQSRLYMEMDMAQYFSAGKTSLKEYVTRGSTKPNVAADRPEMRPSLRPAKVSFRLEYAIDNKFVGLGSFFTAGGRVYFFISRVRGSNNREGAGLCRINAVRLCID